MIDIQGIVRELAAAVKDASENPKGDPHIAISIDRANEILIILLAQLVKDRARTGSWNSPFEGTQGEAYRRAREEDSREREHKRYEDFHRQFEQAYGRPEDWFRQREENEFFRSGFRHPGDQSTYQEYDPPKQDEKRPWHEVLGIRKTATKPERLRAYRSLAMKYHPDRKPHGDVKKFQELQEAREEAGIAK